MFSPPTVDTPFASSQGPSTLSPDAPEFFADPARPRTNSLHKAKDSVSSMTEVGGEQDEPKTPAANGPAEAATGGDREPTPGGSWPESGGLSPARSSTLEKSPKSPKAPLLGPISILPRPGTNGSGNDASTTANGPKPDNASRPPSSRPPGRNNSFSSAAGSNSPYGGNHRRQAYPQPSGQMQQNMYPDPYGRSGQQMMVAGSPQAPFYQPLYGQLFPMPLPMGVPQRNGQMGTPTFVYPQGPSPLIMQQPPPHWQHFMPVLPDQYGGPGYAPPMGLPPAHMPGAFFPQGFPDDHFPAHVGGDQGWRPPAVLDSHSSFPASASSRSLNAAAQGWTPDDRSTASASRPSSRPSTAGGTAALASGAGHSRGPSVDSIPEHARAPEGEAPLGHRRMPSTSSSERKKGHRRNVSVPVDFQEAAPEPAEPDPEPSEIDKPLRPKKKGHRRQSSLPTAADMERLKEGGKKAGHRRSESWMSNGRSSAVLEDFKSSKDSERRWTLADVKGHILEFCKDQTGSRFIQQALDKDATPEQVKDVAAEAKHRFAMLMEDVFGNYVVQKLLERAAAEDKKWMAERICRDNQKPNQPNRAVVLSKHQYGCRVVQKALETLELEDKTRIMEQLLESTLDLVADQNGNHVIQKCIECIKPTIHIEPLIGELLSGKESRSIPTLRGEVVPLSQHTYGCRVVQRVLEHCDEQAFKERFMVEILKRVHELSRNIYSNYVIQHVLEFGKPDEKECVLRDLSQQMVALSRDKFASNVVERCLQFGSLEQRRSIIEEFLVNEQALVQMMKDDYGNYVCFRAFDLAEDNQKKRLAEVIKRSVAAVRRTSFGKNFHTRLVDRYPAFFQSDLGIHTAPSVKAPISLRQQLPQAAGRPRVQTGRAQPMAVPVLPSTPPKHEVAHPPQSLPSPREPAAEPPQPQAQPERAHAAEAVAIKSEEAAGKPMPGHVSVTADGANPPLHPPVPAAATAEEKASHHPAEAGAAADGQGEGGQAPLSRTASHEGPISSSPVPVLIEG